MNELIASMTEARRQDHDRAWKDEKVEVMYL